MCLGKKLDKSNQFSNWAQRPLRKEQLRYAALDAFCLLEIYDAIEKQLTHIQLDPNEILNALLNDVRPPSDSGTRRAGRQDGSSGSRRNHRDKYNKRHAYAEDSNSGNSSRAHQNRTKSKGAGLREQQTFEGPNTKSVL